MLNGNGNDNATKKLIRDTATRLFREKSFEAVTLHEICRESGINKHTFYYYFKSKDELLEYYYTLPWNLTASEATEILTSDNYVDQLWLIVRKFINYMQKTGVEIMRQIIIKNLTQDKGTFLPNSEMWEIFRLEVSIVKKGQQAGQFRNHGDPKVLVMVIQQILHANCLMWSVSRGDFDFDAFVRFLIENLLDVDNSYRTTSENILDDFFSKMNCNINESKDSTEDKHRRK
jgi:AcrR family transcriptional regulator